MTPILLLIRDVIYTELYRLPAPRGAAAHTRARARAYYTADYALSQRNTPQTFEHRAFPRFGRDIGGLDLAFSESFTVAGTCRS